MSSATKEILGRVRQLVPPMLDKFHKGKLPAPHLPGAAASDCAQEKPCWADPQNEDRI